MPNKDMMEMAPWGKTWARTSKMDYKNIITNLSIDINNGKAVMFMRDLLYNPCHNLENAVELSKHLNNFEV